MVDIFYLSKTEIAAAACVGVSVTFYKVYGFALAMIAGAGGTHSHLSACT